MLAGFKRQGSISERMDPVIYYLQQMIRGFSFVLEFNKKTKTNRRVVHRLQRMAGGKIILLSAPPHGQLFP
ncbi:MAG: hypothetical protein WBO38_12595, partial [Chitinophagaceae bacterium]